MVVNCEINGWIKWNNVMNPGWFPNGIPTTKKSLKNRQTN
jgi:hypothetical protein